MVGAIRWWLTPVVAIITMVGSPMVGSPMVGSSMVVTSVVGTPMAATVYTVFVWLKPRYRWLSQQGIH